MYNLTIIAKGNNTAQVFKEQVSALLGRRANITQYTADKGLPQQGSSDLTIISSQAVLMEVKSFIKDMSRVVVTRRSVNYHEIHKLFALPPGEDVLLVNDMYSSAHEAIAMLQMLGLDHLNYHPYFPGCQEYPRLPIAVTPGEGHLVPDCVETVIDIQTRLIDITTIIEILTKLNLLELYADMLSSHYVRDIIKISRDASQVLQTGTRIQSQLQTIINSVHDGIISTDEKGTIAVFNRVAENIFSLPAETALGKDMRCHEQLAKLLGHKGSEQSEFFHKINDRHIILNVAHVAYPTGESGKVYTLKDISEIRRLEESARRKGKDESKLARYTFSDITGKGRAITECLSRARRMAKTEATLLLEGESGTGKELIAQSIHNASLRRSGPFIAVNFAAMTESLLESELFGYEPGAFTGAAKTGSAGLFEAAHKGTIFLDEIGDAPLPFQVRLLRVLQERQIKRVGSSRVIPIDVRVIAASNKDLKALVQAGLFRNDLYYRLCVLPLRLPPLRERPEDIEMLAENIYQKITGRPAHTFFTFILPVMQTYAWPGNIRELHNIVEYLVHTTQGHVPHVTDLPPDMLQSCTSQNETDVHRIYEAIVKAGQLRQPVGRRSLAEGTHLPESRVRAALKMLAEQGKITIGIGRRGIQLREKINQ